MVLIPTQPTKDYQFDTPRGRMFVKVFKDAKGDPTADEPALGTLLTGESGLLGARLSRIERRRDPQNTALDELHLHYERLEAYSAPSAALTAVELRNSRRTWEEGNRRYAERLFVSDDGDAEISRGAVYPDDSGDTDLARVAYAPTIAEHIMIGRYFHRILYVGFLAHSSGTPEIKGSRRTWGDVHNLFAERLFVTNDGASGVTEGTAYPGDSGTSARLSEIPQNTLEITPGRVLTTIKYVGYRTE